MIETKWVDHTHDHCSRTKSRNPLEIALEIMNHDGFPIAGHAHHALVAGAIVAAWRNATGASDNKVLETAIKRADSLPAGFCAGFGADVGAIAAGISISVIRGNTVRAEHSPGRALAHQLTGLCMLIIANNRGNRCCKRTVFQVLDTATNFFRANLDVPLEYVPAAELQCPYADQNQLCNREDCRYFRAGESQRPSIKDEGSLRDRPRRGPGLDLLTP